MGKPITVSINLDKIDDRHVFKGKKGRYLDIALFPNRDGVDEYGNSGFVAQDLPREARDAGERGEICGNWKDPDAQPAQRHQRGSSYRGDRRDDRPARDYQPRDRERPDPRRDERESREQSQRRYDEQEECDF